MSRYTPGQRTNGGAGSTRTVRRPFDQDVDPASSVFAKLEHDPIEDHCLARLLQNPSWYCSVAELRAEYFRRPENREIVNHILYVALDGFDEGAIEWLKQTVEDELGQHLEYLFNRKLPPLEGKAGEIEVNQTIHRLEERYLRELKLEEAARFSESTTDGLPEEPEHQILEVNQRIKRNEIYRNCLVPNVSERR